MHLQITSTIDVLNIPSLRDVVLENTQCATDLSTVITWVGRLRVSQHLTHAVHDLSMPSTPVLVSG